MNELDLPEDIWRCIAQFIPVHVMMNLYATNHVFLQLAFNLRYEEVRLLDANNASRNLLQRLQDPFVAKRVRKLRVKSSKFSELPFELVFGFLVQLTQLQTYHIIWSEPFADSNAAAAPLDLLLLPMTTSKSLRKLAVEYPPHELHTLFPQSLALQYLEEVEICVCYSLNMYSSEEHDRLSANIARFLNQSQSTLRSISLHSSIPLDTTSFFNALDQFKNLKSFELSIPSEKPHLGDWKPLQSFLNHHSGTLREFTLKGYPHINPDHHNQTIIQDDSTVFAMMEVYIHPFFADISLPNLEKLVIDTKWYSLGTILCFFNRFYNPEMTVLEITGRTLDTEAVENIVLALGSSSPNPNKLRRLCLATTTLFPELFDLLAQNLADLKDLEILIKDVVPKRGQRAVSSQPTPGFGGLRRARRSTRQDFGQIDEFLSEMSQRSYPDWKLEQLAIWKVEGNTLKDYMHRQYQGTYVSRLRECVPSLGGQVVTDV